MVGWILRAVELHLVMNLALMRTKGTTKAGKIDKKKTGDRNHEKLDNDEKHGYVQNIPKLTRGDGMSEGCLDSEGKSLGIWDGKNEGSADCAMEGDSDSEGKSLGI